MSTTYLAPAQDHWIVGDLERILKEVKVRVFVRLHVHAHLCLIVHTCIQSACDAISEQLNAFKSVQAWH